MIWSPLRKNVARSQIAFSYLHRPNYGSEKSNINLSCKQAWWHERRNAPTKEKKC